jgi:hypothetical protein
MSQSTGTYLVLARPRPAACGLPESSGTRAERPSMIAGVLLV